MRNVSIACTLASMIGLGLVLPLAARPADEGIKVALKDFKFKNVKEGTESLVGHNEDEGKLFYYINGTAEATVKAPAEADYEIIVKAACDSAQNERAKFKLAVDGKEVGKETLLTDDGPKDYPFTTKLTAGDHKITVEYTNDVYKEGEYDRNFYLHGLTVKKK
jgi:Ca-dependent carbohydrate-binding module xylan-binding